MVELGRQRVLGFWKCIQQCLDRLTASVLSDESGCLFLISRAEGSISQQLLHTLKIHHHERRQRQDVQRVSDRAHTHAGVW